MRLGAPIFEKVETPGEWIAALARKGYSAAYCPVGLEQGEDVARAYADAAAEAGVVIAEVGAWSNPLSPKEDERAAARARCESQLHLADVVGANCCVNIAGSRGELWDGPDAQNLTDETFDLIVEVVRGIIDAVKPTRTYYALETMPWMYPDSVDSYVRLLKAIHRERFAVHLDPVNLVNSPQRFFGSSDLICECFAKLGPHIKSCHGKDVAMQEKAITHLDEIRPGLGKLDHATYIREIEACGPDTPLMLEHLSSEEEYDQAAEYVRGVAEGVGAAIK